MAPGQPHALTLVGQSHLGRRGPLAAVLLDLLLPEPPNALHPVVWVGKVTGALRRVAPRHPVAAFAYGCVMVVVVVGGAGAAAWFGLAALAGIHPIAYLIGGAVVLRTAFAVTGLTAAAHRTRRALVEGRLEAARESLRSLVSRDATALTPPLVAAAAIESVAENTTDSFVGPWIAFAVFGVPGAIAYRALNTMDSMVGYRGATEYLGKAAARLDDVGQSDSSSTERAAAACERMAGAASRGPRLAHNAARSRRRPPAQTRA